MNEDTFPHPTGPIIQIKSPGWASNWILLRENNPFYINIKKEKIWNERENVFTCCHCARCKLHSTLECFFIDVGLVQFSSMFISCADKFPLYSSSFGVANNRWSLWDSSNKRNAWREVVFHLNTLVWKQTWIRFAAVK